MTLNLFAYLKDKAHLEPLSFNSDCLKNTFFVNMFIPQLKGYCKFFGNMSEDIVPTFLHKWMTTQLCCINVTMSMLM